MLDEAVSILKKNPEIKVEIDGHTDNTGSAVYNMNLSERRAKAVMKYFVDKGVGLFTFTSGSNSLDDSLAIADHIIREGLKINYSFFTRSEPGVKHDQEDIVSKYVKLIKSGLRAVFIGAESGNDEVLKKVMNKGATSEDIEYTVKAIQEASNQANIPVDLIMSIIYPHPTMEGISLGQAYEDTLSLVKRTMPDSVMAYPPAPFAGTKWTTEERFGFDYHDPKNPQTEDLSRQEKSRLVTREMMEMEYILFLPPSKWNTPNITVNGLGAQKIFKMNEEFRNAVKELGIATDLSDEQFMMFRSLTDEQGNYIYEGRQGALVFKRKIMQSIVSCKYDNVQSFYDSVNKKSEELARSSLLNMNEVN